MLNNVVVPEFRCLVRERSNLAWLRPAIREWHNYMVRYAEFHRKDEESGSLRDVAYYFNERADVSLLAGGACIAGFAAIEEYRTSKTRKGQGAFKGRGDLYITGPRDGVIIEAKHAFIDIDHEETLEKSIDSAFQEAKRAAIEHPKYLNTRRAGCIFLVPHFDRVGRGTEANKINERIEKFTKEVEKQFGKYKIDLLAWSFPEITRLFTHKDDDKVWRHYPGAMLAIGDTASRK